MTQPAPGRVLAGRYRLDQLIARGGMATVWLGRDDLLGRRVAVKTLHPDLAHDDALRGRFRQEAVAAAALSHPNIVATYDTGEYDGIAFIVMELVEGESLRQLLNRRGVLDPQEASAIAHQVALALEHAHRQGIVHRDIKPANVLVSHDGPVKVTDFGIAKAAGVGDYTRTGTVVGTARYLSPEQVQGQPTDARADVYALGLVLYELLAGQPAYSGDSEMATALARLTGPPPPLASVRPGIPPALAAVVEQALQPDPAHRIPSAAAFDLALARAAEGITPPPHRASPPPGPAPTPPPLAPRPTSPAGRRPVGPRAPTPRPGTRRPPRRRHPWRVVAFLVFLVAVGLAAGYVTTLLVEDDGAPGSDGSSAGPTVVSATDFDPEPGDGTENPDAVGFALDGDPTTAWRSETYGSRDLGGLKPGVGLALTLAEGSDVGRVEIDGAPGADVEVYVADQAGATLADWGPARAAATGTADLEQIDVDPPASGSAVLVWFTRTPASGRIEVRELRVA